MTKARMHFLFVVRISSFHRHWTFGIRHFDFVMFLIASHNDLI
jgi:hypothetical protein